MKINILGNHVMLNSTAVLEFEIFYQFWEVRPEKDQKRCTWKIYHQILSKNNVSQILMKIRVLTNQVMVNPKQFQIFQFFYQFWKLGPKRTKNFGLRKFIIKFCHQLFQLVVRFTNATNLFPRASFKESLFFVFLSSAKRCPGDEVDQQHVSVQTNTVNSL